MKVGIIMGGPSSEREISLNTGNEILKNLDRSKYTPVPVVFDRLDELVEKTKDIDMGFIALHGRYGEDGTVQGLLECLGVPYTGCGVLSSAICMNKDVSKRLFRQAGLNTADWILVERGGKFDSRALEELGLPLVVKPASEGSSFGVTIARSLNEVNNAVSRAMKYDREVILERYIEGDEITCSILNGKMLPVLAIKPKSAFFDYASKYADGGADEYAVELDPAIHGRVEGLALGAYHVMKCSVYARIDMILREGIPFILEANTLPGMTKNSLLPKSAAAAGISFSRLLDIIIESSLQEHGSKAHM